MAETYEYPDQDDLITRRGLEASDPYPGYWVESERRVLDLMFRAITRGKRGFASPSWMMDAGCGWGRLLPTFQGHFDRVLAVEPDPGRLEGARKAAREKGFASKVDFVCSQIQELDWPEASVDVAICSHIIQHVRTDLAPRIVRRIADLLRPGGLLLLTTSHSTLGREVFALGKADGGKASFHVVDESVFNRVAFGGAGEGLPVRFYTIRSLEGLLAESGLEAFESRTFQIVARSRLLSAIDALVGRDRLANALPVLKDRLGTNIYVGARKA
jgi:SAM-dependent methyltransferase